MTVREPGAVVLGRDEARDLARDELARREYQLDRPGLLERAWERVRDALGELLDGAAGAAPGGWPGLVLVLVLAVLAVVALRVRVGPLSRGHGERALFVDRPRSSAEHRRGADDAAGAGLWGDAVRERVRALVRDLEERGVIDHRPGRTADEAARDAGLGLPAHGEDLASAARLFDGVAYGARAATAEHDAWLRALDDRVRAARPTRPAGTR